MDRRPQGLTIVGIVMLVAGLLSTCCNLYGIASAIMQVGMGAVLGHEGISDPSMGPMLAMQREIAIYTGVPALLGVAAALFVVAAGGLALSMRPMGRTLAIAACGVAIFVALLDTGMSAFASFRMTTLMGRLDPGLGSGGGAGFGGSMAPILAAGIGMAVVWLVLKIGIYAPCLAYFLRKETADLFGTSAGAPPSVRGD